MRENEIGGYIDTDKSSIERGELRERRLIRHLQETSEVPVMLIGIKCLI